MLSLMGFFLGSVKFPGRMGQNRNSDPTGLLPAVTYPENNIAHVLEAMVQRF